MDFVKEITGQKKHEEGAEGAIHKLGDKVGQGEEKASKAGDSVLDHLSDDAKSAGDKLESKKSNQGVLGGITDKINSVAGGGKGSESKEDKLDNTSL